MRGANNQAVDVSNRSRPLASRRIINPKPVSGANDGVSNRSRPLASRRTQFIEGVRDECEVSNRSRPLASRRNTASRSLSSMILFPIDRVP